MGEVYNNLPCTIEDVVGLVGIQSSATPIHRCIADAHFATIGKHI